MASVLSFSFSGSSLGVFSFGRFDCSDLISVSILGSNSVICSFVIATFSGELAGDVVAGSEDGRFSEDWSGFDFSRPRDDGALRDDWDFEEELREDDLESDLSEFGDSLEVLLSFESWLDDVSLDPDRSFRLEGPLLFDGSDRGLLSLLLRLCSSPPSDVGLPPPRLLSDPRGSWSG